MAGAIAPAAVLRRYQDQPGAKAPGQRPPRPRQALLARRAGRWPLLFPDLPVYRAPSCAGGETRCVSCSRLEGRSCAILDARSLWQGPSPLPQRHAGIRTSRGSKPPASARPAPGGRFSPAGSGAGLSLFPDLPVCGAPSRAGGGNALRFLFPPGRAKAPSPLDWQGPSPLPQRCAGIRTSRGPKPGPAPVPSRLQYESNLPFVSQAFWTCPFHGRNMHQFILAPAIRRDEAETPGAAEPFHGAFRHAACPFAAQNRGSCRASRATPSGPRQGAGHARKTAPDHKKESSTQGPGPGAPCRLPPQALGQTRSGGSAAFDSSLIMASNDSVSVFVSPRRRRDTVRSCTSFMPMARITGTLPTECSRTL